MARRFDGVSGLATANYAFAATVPPTTKITVAAWVYRESTTANLLILEQGNTLGTGYDVVQMGSAGTADIVRSFQGANSWADSYTPPATGAWHHMAWSFTSTGSNFVWIDGAPQSLTNAGHAASFANFGTDVMSVGGRVTGGVASAWWPGRIAELGIWTDRLNNNHVAALALGVQPCFVFQEGLVCYSPYQGDPSPEPNYTPGQEVWTLTGTTVANHPGVRSEMSMRQ